MAHRSSWPPETGHRWLANVRKTGVKAFSQLYAEQPNFGLARDLERSGLSIAEMSVQLAQRVAL
jgi:hypothetical protein